MVFHTLQQLQDIIVVETRKAEELRKKTLYIIGSDGEDMTEQLIAEHEKRAAEAHAAMALLKQDFPQI